MALLAPRHTGIPDSYWLAAPVPGSDWLSDLSVRSRPKTCMHSGAKRVSVERRVRQIFAGSVVATVCSSVRPPARTYRPPTCTCWPCYYLFLSLLPVTPSLLPVVTCVTGFYSYLLPIYRLLLLSVRVDLLLLPVNCLLICLAYCSLLQVYPVVTFSLATSYLLSLPVFTFT